VYICKHQTKPVCTATRCTQRARLALKSKVFNAQCVCCSTPKCLTWIGKHLHGVKGGSPWHALSRPWLEAVSYQCYQYLHGIKDPSFSWSISVLWPEYRQQHAKTTLHRYVCTYRKLRLQSTIPRCFAYTRQCSTAMTWNTQAHQPFKFNGAYSKYNGHHAFYFDANTWSQRHEYQRAVNDWFLSHRYHVWRDSTPVDKKVALDKRGLRKAQTYKESCARRQLRRTCCFNGLGILQAPVVKHWTQRLKRTTTAQHLRTPTRRRPPNIQEYWDTNMHTRCQYCRNEKAKKACVITARVAPSVNTACSLEKVAHVSHAPSSTVHVYCSVAIWKPLHIEAIKRRIEC
jgi:hypothetical protein